MTEPEVALLKEIDRVSLPPIEDRTTLVHRRIRRTRNRRLTTAMAGLVVVALLVALAPNLGFPVLTPSAAEPPTSVYAPDGFSYQLIGAGSVQTWRSQTLTIIVTPAPETTVLSVRASCSLAAGFGQWKQNAMGLHVKDRDSSQPFFNCPRDASRMVDIPIDQLERVGDTVRLQFQMSETSGDAPSDWPTDWTFGIYQRVGPVGEPFPPTPIALPLPATLTPLWASGHVFTHYQTQAGTYPEQRLASITVPAGHTILLVTAACSSPFVGLPAIAFVTDDTDAAEPPTSVDCTDGSATVLAAQGAGVKLRRTDRATTVTVTIQPPASHQDRAMAWAVAVYLG